MVESIFKSLHFGEIFWDKAPYSVAKVDLSGRVVDANETLRVLLGYDKGELNGLLFDEITHPEDLLKDRKNFGDLVSGSITHYTIRKRYITKSGITIMAQLYVYGVYNEDTGALEYVIGMVLPVSGYNSKIWGFVARDVKYVRRVLWMIIIGTIAAVAKYWFGIDISSWF